MNAKKYVPDRLRGVLGRDDANRSSSSSSRGKGRKSRPWRVDAASWKQQLQERKAVYDNFALQEKADEDMEKSSHSRKMTNEEELEATPLNVLTSTTAGGGGQVETMLTPKRGGSVETVYTSASKKPSLVSSPSSLTRNNSSVSSSSSSSKDSSPRRSSSLSRNRSKADISPSKYAAETSPHRRKRSDDFDSNNCSSHDDKEIWISGDELSTSKSVDSSDSTEYFIDTAELESSKSKDSNVAIVNGIANVKKKIHKNKIFRPKARARLLRHGDSDDTAESVGFPGDEKEGEPSSDNPVNRLSMMDAVEDFIDPSRPDNKYDSPKRSLKSNSQWPSVKSIDEITNENDVGVNDKEEIIVPRNPIFARRSAGAEIVVREISTRRGGRRQQRESPTKKASRPQLSPATSTTSTSGTVMGNSSRKDASFRSQTRSLDYDDKGTKSNGTNNNVYAATAIGGDDEWSIRPVPSEEEICLEKRRWPLREDAHTATMSSGDTDINSVKDDVVFIPSTSRGKNCQKEIEHDLKNRSTDSEEELESILMREQIALSLPPSPGNGIERERTPQRENHGSGEMTSTTRTGATPDPLQRARKSLMVSNLNRSVRSLLDSSTSSRHDDDTIGDSSMESSFSTSIFVPLRSHPQRYDSESDNPNEIPLNVLDERGVYVSQYNMNGIYVHPNNDPIQPATETSERNIANDMYNELGVYVPHDKPASLLKDSIQDNNIVEEKVQSDVKVDPDESGSTPPSDITQMEKVLENSQKIATIESGDDADKECEMDASGIRNLLENNEESVAFTLVAEEEGHVIRTESGNVGTHSEGTALSQEQLQSESVSSNDNKDGENIEEDTSSLAESTEEDSTNECDPRIDSGDKQLKTIQSDSDQIHTASEKNDGSCQNGVGDGDNAVDEIATNRIRLISDLKQGVHSIYTGDHICVESIGTSEDPNPLDTARRKRAAIETANKVARNVDLKVQLNDTVSALNTDHHHVIESPGAMKSVKGKKWKERMAMKKLSKKNSTDTKNEEKLNLPRQESTDSDTPSFGNEGQLEVIKSVENLSTNSAVVENSSGQTKEKKGDECLDEHLKGTDEIDQTSSAQNITEEPEIVDISSSLGKSEGNISDSRDTYNGTVHSSHDESQEPENTNIVTITKELEDIGLATPDTIHVASDSARDDPEEVKGANIISIANEPEDIHPSTVDNNAETVDDAQELSEPKIPSVKLSSEKPLESNPDTLDNGSNTIDNMQDIPQELDVSCTFLNSEIIKDTNSPTINKGGDIAAFVVSDERQGHIPDLTTGADDNNIIQGLPPNKGKKWKDRLKKKKNKKSEKNGATIKDDSEIGEGASGSTRTATANHMQDTILISPSSSHGEDSLNSKSSKARPSFNRNLSDLTTEERQRAASPTIEVQTESSPQLSPTNEFQTGSSPKLSLTNEVQTESPKNIGKKSNKWKNRLAKKKGSKQDNIKSTQVDLKPDLPSATSERGRILVDFKSPDTSLSVKPELSSVTSNRGEILVDFKRPDIASSMKPELPSSTSERGQILVDFKRPDLSPPGALESTDNVEQPFVGLPNTPKHLQNHEVHIPTEASTHPNISDKIQSPSQNQSKAQDPKIHQNLRQSFDVFDAFLQNGRTDPTDDESLYTEMTIGQETMLQSEVPESQRSEEEELSYMDFTMEDSHHPSFVEQNDVPKVAPKDQMMSPFMANLLGSRMFQDAAISIPKMSLPKEEEHDKQNKLVGSPDENLKKFPTITVGDDFDDDMTQITMGSLEDDQHDKENGDEDKFFDAESKPFPRSPSSKSIGKKSKLSMNSRKSEGASSRSSELSCSEASKQRIVEILRKEVWSRDNNVVKNAMEELDTEAKNGRHHRAHIVRCGGVMTIMRAMEMNSTCEAIQIASCSTLEKLALDSQTQTAICEMEGISLVVRSMQANFENIQLQEAACVALATICRQQEASTSIDLMKDAKEAVPTILSCMTRYPTNARIQSKGFQAIANLCSDSHAHKRLEELSKAGGIMTLTMALQTPWENKIDQHEAISNLSILLRGITELNEKSSLVPSGDEILKETNNDGTSGSNNNTQSIAHQEINNGELSGDNNTVISCMEDIPDIPMMSTMSINGDEIPDLDHHLPPMSINGEEIPDLDQYPSMMSNLEWQNFGEDDLDAGRKKSTDPISPSSAGAQQQGADGKKGDSEEQCTIQ